MITIPVPIEFTINSSIMLFVIIIYRRLNSDLLLRKLFKDVIVSIILGALSLLFEDFIYLLLPFMFLLVEIYKQHSIKFEKIKIIYFLIAVILELIINIAVQNICSIAIHLINTESFYNGKVSFSKTYLVLGTFVTAMVVLLISKMISRFSFRLKELEEKIVSFKLDNQIFWMLLSLFVSFEVIMFMGDIEGITSLIGGTLIVSFFAFTGLMIWIVFNLIQVWSVKQKVANSIEQNQQFDDYLKSIQQQYDDLRKFKHDFKNIILSMKVDSSEDFNRNYEELYQELIGQKEMNSELEGRILSEYKKITNEPLRGLIIQKFFKAKSNNVNLDVQISSEFINITRDVLDIIRIVGILLDNAIEETIKCQDKNISLAFIKNDNNLEISIENSLSHSIDIRKIFEEGYSTKGTGRGTGLANVSNIVDSRSNLYLDTETVKNHFRITLIILEGR